MPLIDAERNAAADAEAGRLGYVSLHTATPGTTGASEVTGGAYARKPLVFAAASGGTATAAEVTLDIPANTAATHFGVWTALTGGTFRGGNALSVAPPSTSVASQVKLTVSVPVTAS